MRRTHLQKLLLWSAALFLAIQTHAAHGQSSAARAEASLTEAKAARVQRSFDRCLQSRADDPNRDGVCRHSLQRTHKVEKAAFTRILKGSSSRSVNKQRLQAELTDCQAFRYYGDFAQCLTHVADRLDAALKGQTLLN